MSRANSTLALMVAISAPWTNGTASANARNELVGNPGSRVSAFSPPAFTASRSIGKTSGKTTFAGCRAVRTTARLPRAAVWTRAVALIGRSTSSGLAFLLDVLLITAGTLEVPSRLCEEDVVQRRLVDLKLGQ